MLANAGHRTASPALGRSRTGEVISPPSAGDAGHRKALRGVAATILIEAERHAASHAIHHHVTERRKATQN